MKTVYRELLLLIVSVTLLSSAALGQITTTGSGNWSSTTPDAPWPGGVVPGSGDDVVVAVGHTVTVDTTNAACNNLTADGYLYFALTTDRAITINGNVVVNSGGRIRPASSTPTGQFFHSIEIKGDLTVNSGGTFDMRQSSSANFGVCRVLFSGSTNSTINLALTSYTSNTEEFNSVEINKSSGAKVILASGNLFQNNNSSNAPDTLILTSGIIETGSNHWVHLRTSDVSIVGASSSSYVHGILGRGITNGGGLNTRDFPIGDSANYRPVNVRLSAPANATGHYVWATVRNGDANTGSSTFNGGIDKVSEIRYFEIGYLQNAGSSATMDFYGFGPSYGDDDGVAAGNMDLRAAYSADSGSSWTDHGPTDHTTDLTSPPTSILGDSLTSNLTVNTGNSVFVALARATGTTTNTLAPPPPVVTPSLVHLVYPRFVGSVGSPATLQNPIAYYFEISDLPPSTLYDGMHMGFNGESNPGSTRGSKWRADTESWVSPSTLVSPFGTSDAEGILRSWIALRPPTNFIAEPYRLHLRVRGTAAMDTLKFDSEFDITALVFDSSATGETAGAVVYGYTDTVSQNNGGHIILAYENETDERPMAAWLIWRSSEEESDLYTTRTDTLYRRNGYFQLLVPANTPIAKLEVRDSSNAVVRLQTSASWMSGVPGSQTNLNTQDAVVLSVEKISGFIPQSFEVSQNFPNPFNPSTTIHFSLKNAGDVVLKVYDITGREIVELVNDRLAAGTYQVQWNAAGLASGVYFYSISAAGVHETKRMVLLK